MRRGEKYLTDFIWHLYGERAVAGIPEVHHGGTSPVYCVSLVPLLDSEGMLGCVRWMLYFSHEVTVDGDLAFPGDRT